MRIKQFFKELNFKIRVFWLSLFRGMKSADLKMMGTVKGGDISDSGIEESIEQNHVFNDMLNENITQEVQEMVDSNYRVFRHANNFQYIGNGNVVKKKKNMIVDNHKIFNPEDYPVVLIQDNKMVVKGVLEATNTRYENEGDVASDDIDDRYTIKIEREVFPRFLIEKYIKKIVVREAEQNVKVDLYCSSYPRQFRPTDALFINELMNIFGKKNRILDTVEIETIEFITDKAYNVDDILFFKFGNMKFEEINMYEKDFVLTYSALPICNAIDLTEKYKTESLDEKYRTNAPKRENIERVYDFENEFYETDTLNTDEALSLIKELNISNFEKTTEK